MTQDFTTVALTQDDKERLDVLADQHLDVENPSYRDVINHLADEYENRQDDYENILARAIANADEDDAERIIQRVEHDKEFVEQLSDDA